MTPGCGKPLCDLHLTWKQVGVNTSGHTIPPEAIENVIHFDGGHRIILANDGPATLILCGTIRRPATP